VTATLPTTGAAPIATEDAVARRAYDLFLGRGSEHGHDLDDWFAAERELRMRDAAT
jgi:hypothetical protein